MAHPPLPELEQRLFEAREQVPMGMYESYKGETYQVIGYLLVEKTDEAMIEYFAEKAPHVKWGKTLLEWFEPAEVDGTIVPRFTFLQ